MLLLTQRDLAIDLIPHVVYYLYMKTLPKTMKYKLTHVPSKIFSQAQNGIYLDDLVSDAVERGWKTEDIKIEVIPELPAL